MRKKLLLGLLVLAALASLSAGIFVGKAEATIDWDIRVDHYAKPDTEPIEDPPYITTTVYVYYRYDPSDPWTLRASFNPDCPQTAHGFVVRDEGDHETIYWKTVWYGPYGMDRCDNGERVLMETYQKTRYAQGDNAVISYTFQ